MPWKWPSVHKSVFLMAGTVQSGRKTGTCSTAWTGVMKTNPTPSKRAVLLEKGSAHLQGLLKAPLHGSQSSILLYQWSIFNGERGDLCLLNHIQHVESAMEKYKINRKVHGSAQRFALNLICNWLIYLQEFPDSRLLIGLWAQKHRTANGKLELSDTIYISSFQRNHWIVHVLVERAHLFPSSK